MAQSFALLGSDVTVINRSSTLFQSKFGDTDAAQILQQQLEKVNATLVDLFELRLIPCIDPSYYYRMLLTLSFFLFRIFFFSYRAILCLVTNIGRCEIFIECQNRKG